MRVPQTRRRLRSLLTRGPPVRLVAILNAGLIPKGQRGRAHGAHRCPRLELQRVRD